MRILTCCRAGLVRSVALADVLKLHYRDTDVIPIGLDFNDILTKQMLFEWADLIVVMEEHFKAKIPEEYLSKVVVCEVGPDSYGSSKNPQLIDTVWRWVRENARTLALVEHEELL